MKYLVNLVAALIFGLAACAGSTPAQEEPKASPEAPAVVVEQPEEPAEKAPAVEEPAESSEVAPEAE